MNLSHDELLEPDMDCADGQKCRKAGREPLLADDQTAVLLLKPGPCPQRAAP